MNTLSPEMINLFYELLSLTNILPLIICSMITTMIYLRLQKTHQQAIEQLRIKISADLHDEVGSLLSGLAMQAELMEVLNDQDRITQAQQIAIRSREAMASMRDVVWSLDARKDNWDSLMDRLREHACEVLEPKNIAFEIKTEGVNRSKELSAEMRKHLYLIGKEAITNVAKHSNANCVTICIHQTGHRLEVSIQDNGEVPAKSQRKAAGLGLSNITMRAQALGAKLDFVYQNGFGINLSMGIAA